MNRFGERRRSCSKSRKLTGLAEETGSCWRTGSGPVRPPWPEMELEMTDGPNYQPHDVQRHAPGRPPWMQAQAKVEHDAAAWAAAQQSPVEPLTGDDWRALMATSVYILLGGSPLGRYFANRLRRGPTPRLQARRPAVCQGGARDWRHSRQRDVPSLSRPPSPPCSAHMISTRSRLGGPSATTASSSGSPSAEEPAGSITGSRLPGPGPVADRDHPGVIFSTLYLLARSLLGGLMLARCQVPWRYAWVPTDWF